MLKPESRAFRCKDAAMPIYMKILQTAAFYIPYPPQTPVSASSNRLDSGVICWATAIRFPRLLALIPLFYSLLMSCIPNTTFHLIIIVPLIAFSPGFIPAVSAHPPRLLKPHVFFPVNPSVFAIISSSSFLSLH